MKKSGSINIQTFESEGVTLLFNFADDRTLIDRVNGLELDFARSGPAYSYNASGILVLNGNDEPRFDYNPTSLESLGLQMEGETENILIQSNDFSDALYDKRNITINKNITGPDNVANSAWQFTDDAVDSDHAVRQVAIFPSVDNRRVSVFVQGGTARYATLANRFYTNTPSSRVSVFDTQAGIFTHPGAAYSEFDVLRLPNNWWRISQTAFDVNAAYDDWWCGVSGGPDALDSTYSGTGLTMHFYSGQAEFDFTTSLIDTGASAVSRASEACFTTNLAWIDQVLGTLFAKYKSPHSGASRRILSLNDGSLTNRNTIFTNSTNVRPNTLMTVAGVTQSSLVSTAVVAVGDSVKVAYAWQQDDFAMSTQGAAVVTENLGDIAVVSRLDIGYESAATNELFSHIQQAGYANVRKDNLFLEGVTS